MRVKENKPSRSKFLEGKIIPLKCYTQSKHIMTDEKCQGFKQGGEGAESAVSKLSPKCCPLQKCVLFRMVSFLGFLLVHLNILLPK